MDELTEIADAEFGVVLRAQNELMPRLVDLWAGPENTKSAIMCSTEIQEALHVLEKREGLCLCDSQLAFQPLDEECIAVGHYSRQCTLHMV